MPNMTERVCILDYGSGNVQSVRNIFAALSPGTIVSNREADIRDATHLVLPGVGAFGAAMERIRERIPLEIITQEVLEAGKPFLGICVGMQVLADTGYEFGEHAGLGWVHGRVSRLGAVDLPLPHVGWNDVTPRANSRLHAQMPPGMDFYFVHSYALEPDRPEVTSATATYGTRFCASVEQDNIFGVQFHPEKSSKAGTELLKNFLRTS